MKTQFLVLFIGVLFQLEVPQAPRGPVSNEQPEIACTLGTLMVIVEVEVKDPSGYYVSGLKAQDFIVYENGEAHRIVFCSEHNTDTVTHFAREYLIGYTPRNTTNSPRLRKIKVKFATEKNGELSIRYYPKKYRVKRTTVLKKLTVDIELRESNITHR